MNPCCKGLLGFPLVIIGALSESQIVIWLVQGGFKVGTCEEEPPGSDPGIAIYDNSWDTDQNRTAEQEGRSAWFQLWSKNYKSG